MWISQLQLQQIPIDTGPSKETGHVEGAVGGDGKTQASGEQGGCSL